jgi:hypothetical protein
VIVALLTRSGVDQLAVHLQCLGVFAMVGEHGGEVVPHDQGQFVGIGDVGQDRVVHALGLGEPSR